MPKSTAVTRLSLLLVPPIIVIVLSSLLLLGIYRRPHVAMYNGAGWRFLASGLHEPEEFGGLSYAYTQGDATIRFPATGLGQFLLALRLGGPGASSPVSARLMIGSAQLNLGSAAGLRTYHVLMPAEADGTAQLRLLSPTNLLPNDPRSIGLMIDWIAVRSLAPASPPALLIISAALTLALFWIVLRQLEIGAGWSIAALALVGAILCASTVAGRGWTDLRAWWLGAGVAAVVGLGLSRFDGRQFRSPVWAITGLLLVWRGTLWLAGAFALWFSADVHRYARELSGTFTPPSTFGRTFADYVFFAWQALANAWMQWDGEHYLAIALDGYRFEGTFPNIAFFPLYPLLVRICMLLTGGDAVVAALLVTHVALFVALLVLYDLVTHDFGKAAAYRSLIVLLCFPTAFFLAAGYTESLALALVLLVLWAIRRQRWWLAGAMGGLLALTRLPGVLIAPVLAVAYLQQHDWRWRAIRAPVLAVLLPPLGLGLFMLYQWWRFDTPVAFLIAQQSWDNGAAPPWVVPVEILRSVQESYEAELAVMRLVVWIGFIVLTVFALCRLPLVYGLTTLLLLLPPYFARQPDSLMRHVLIGVPAFIALALLVQRRWLRWLVLSSMLPLLIILTLLFVNGFWVA